MCLRRTQQKGWVQGAGNFIFNSWNLPLDFFVAWQNAVYFLGASGGGETSRLLHNR